MSTFCNGGVVGLGNVYCFVVFVPIFFLSYSGFSFLLLFQSFGAVFSASSEISYLCSKDLSFIPLS